MRRSTFFSITVSAFLGVAAVFGTKAYLNNQRLAMLSALATPEPVVSEIVVASQRLRFGTRLERQSFKTIEWPSSALPPGAFSSIDDIIGDGDKPRYVKASIDVGEPVLDTKITGFGERATLSSAVTPGLKAVSIRVNDVLGVAGFVLPGDRVDIMLTRTQRRSSTTGAYTDVLLQGVKVLAIDQSADDRADKPNVVRTVTLEVATNEAQKLVLAQRVGQLSLTLRNIASADVEEIVPVNIADLGGAEVASGLETNSVTEELSNQADNDAIVTGTTSRFAVIGVSRGVDRVEYKVGKDLAVGSSFGR